MDRLFFIPYKIVSIVFYIETAFIIYLLFSIFSHRIVFRIVSIFKLKIRQKIIVSFIKSIEANLSHLLLLKYYKRFPKQTLLALEGLNDHLNSQNLDPLIKKITEEVLFSEAIKKSDSIFWKIRNYALRIFLINPSISHEKILLKLLQDKVSINQQIAALILVKINSKKGIEAILNLMDPGRAFNYYYFLNLFITFEKQALPIILEIIERPANLSVLSGCLEIISATSHQESLKLDLSLSNTKNTRLKLALIHFLRVQPSKEWEKILIHFSNDPIYKIQLESLKALGSYQSKISIETLTKFIAYPRTQLTYEALRSLSKTEEGLKVLTSQTDEKAQAFLKYLKNFQPS